MRRQWIIGAIAAAFVALLAFWVAANTRWVDEKVPAPPSGEAARNPFYAAVRLVEELGGTAEWRRALGELPDPHAVLVLVYWHWDLIEGRRARLERWVEAGGRLVLVGDLMGGAEALGAWSGLAKDWTGLEEAGDADAEGDGAPGQPADEGLLLQEDPGCTTLGFVAGWPRSSPRRSRYRVCGLAGGRVVSAREPEWALALLPDAAGEEPADVELDGASLQAVRVPLGDGTVTWLNAIAFAYLPPMVPGFGPPLGNQNLLRNDHALLLVELLRLERGDQVIFLSQERGEPLLALTWSYGAPAVVLALVLVALGSWRNAARFGPMTGAPDPARRSLAEQIRGTARFVLATGGGRDLHDAMLRALEEAARLRILNYERLDAGDRSAAIARLTGAPEDALAAAMRPGVPRTRQAFRHSVALLDETRAGLLAGPQDAHTNRRRRGAARSAGAREPIHPR